MCIIDLTIHAVIFIFEQCQILMVLGEIKQVKNKKNQEISVTSDPFNSVGINLTNNGYFIFNTWRIKPHNILHQDHSFDFQLVEFYTLLLLLSEFT